jgi:hypothetical protein
MEYFTPEKPPENDHTFPYNPFEWNILGQEKQNKGGRGVPWLCTITLESGRLLVQAGDFFCNIRVQEHRMPMNAPTITHGLKQIGLGQGMALGILVITAIAFFLGDKQRRERIMLGLFGQ